MKRGFTIIETMIFIAISGLLLVGVLTGVGSSIARQRYNDATRNFAEFLRRQYAAVINPQIQPHEYIDGCHAGDFLGILDGDRINEQYIRDNYFDSEGNARETPDIRETDRGQSSCVYYGVMLIFDDDGRTIERTPIVGLDLSEIKTMHPELDIERLTLEPEYSEMPLDVAILSLANISGGIPYIKILGLEDSTLENPKGSCRVQVKGPPSSERFRFRYESSVVAPEGIESGGVFQPYDMPTSVLIIRSPINGTVKTYYSTNPISTSFNWDGQPVNSIDEFNAQEYNILTGQGNGNANSCGRSNAKVSQEINMRNLARDLDLGAKIRDAGFTSGDIHLCIHSGDVFAYSGRRLMVDIAANGRNQTAVEVIDAEADGSDVFGGKDNYCAM